VPRRPLLLLVLLSLLSLCGVRPAWGGETRLDATRVVWDDGLESLGREAARLVPAVRREVEERLAFGDLERQTDVWVVSGHARAAEVAGGALPEWAVGAALGSRSLIVVRVDLLQRGFGGGMAPVLRHEFVHLAWARYAGERRRLLPLWAEEGLAEYVGGGISVDAGAALDVAAAFGHLINFEDLRDRFPEDPKAADLAYKQSRSWVAHLVEREGWQAWRGILAALGGGGPGGEGGPDPFAGLVRERTSMSLGEWHVAWQQDLEREASPWFHLLFRDLATTLIALLALVGFGAWFFVRRRRRRQLARLGDEPLPMEGDEEPPA
jgi:hypothetical protein